MISRPWKISIMAATNEALRQMDEKAQTQMSKITGGMGGGLPF